MNKPKGLEGMAKSGESKPPPFTAALVDELDKRLIVVMRDGRKLLGTLRSFDQFGGSTLL